MIKLKIDQNLLLYYIEYKKNYISFIITFWQGLRPEAAI